MTTFSTPGGRPGLERELTEAQRRQRRLLGRLEDDRAAGGERRGDLPHRHQQREVPRDDLAADADRLAAGVGEDVGQRVGVRLAGDPRRPAGVLVQVADRALDVDGARQRDRLAVVERLHLGELVGVGLDAARRGGRIRAALGRGHLAPRRVVGERGARGLDRAVDVLRAALGDRGDRLAVGRVDGLERRAVGGGYPLAVDEQAVCSRETKSRVASDSWSGNAVVAMCSVPSYGVRTIFKRLVLGRTDRTPLVHRRGTCDG